MPMPTFKSCRYCRHRKKKCVLPPSGAADSRCFACQHLGTTCEIGTRVPSVKRRLKSQRIASSLSDGPGTGTATLTAAAALHGMPAESILTRVGNGDCQMPRANAESSTEKTIIVPDPIRNPELLTILERYDGIIRHEFPFVTPESLADGGPILSHCIGLATKLSLRSCCPVLSDADVRDLVALLLDDKGTLCTADRAGLLLVLPKLQPDRRLVDRVCLHLRRIPRSKPLAY